MKTRDRYLKETTQKDVELGRTAAISMKDWAKAKKKKQKDVAIKNDERINKICDLVISSSMHYKNGLLTREEYIKSLKMALKRL